jgi:hypothetical protein
MMSEPVAPIQAFVHVGSDGLLNLQLPVDITNADLEVTVSYRQVDRSNPENVDEQEKAAVRREAWRRFVMESYGAIDDPTFFRHEQGELETREEFP